jgi:murein DD-endopeptidase MepM/ murein hydrolase activator NlpD
MRWKWLFVLSLSVAVGAGFLLPEPVTMPVDGAARRDWNPQSFWHGGWGVSGVHKGIDIFAPRGRAVRSASWGLVLYRGELGIGGNVVASLGPKWRIHYYAHLDRSSVAPLSLLAPGEKLGEVGNSGDAVGRPPHLHYAILSLLPRPWHLAFGWQGWKRMFFLDPGRWLVDGGVA